MDYIYTLDWIDVIGFVFLVLLLVTTHRIIRYARRSDADLRREMDRDSRLTSRVQTDVTDALHGTKISHVKIEEVESATDDGADFFEIRQSVRAHREASAGRQEQSRQTEEDKTDLYLSSWYGQQEAQARKIKELEREVLAETAVRNAQESTTTSEALASDLNDNIAAKTSPQKPSPAPKREVHPLVDRLQRTIDDIHSESKELEHIIEHLETSTDFLAQEYTDAIEHWKHSPDHSSAALNEIEQRHRIRTYGLDETWELVFAYPEWIDRSERLLIDLLVEISGHERNRGEALGVMIKRIEGQRWDNLADIDMNALYIVREVRNAARLLGTMRSRMKKLEKTYLRHHKETNKGRAWQPQSVAS